MDRGGRYVMTFEPDGTIRFKGPGEPNPRRVNHGAKAKARRHRKRLRNRKRVR